MLDEETGKPTVEDGRNVIIGGMITSMNTKYTKTNQLMAFLMVEDLMGTIEVVVFPKTFEQYRSALGEDKKVLILGRAQVEDEKDAKLIAQEIHAFDEAAKELWIQFSTKGEFEEKEQDLLHAIEGYEGNDTVVIYISGEKAVKRLPKNWNTSADDGAKETLEALFGAENVKVVQKHVEFQGKRY
jgi:DNA polymerase-3 subunit alpha